MTDSTNHRRTTSIGTDLLLIVATISALAVLPDWPHQNLTDPSYWGVIGFVMLVARLLWLRASSWSRGSANRLTIMAFLVLVPAVYVANWLRFGDSYVQFWIQLAGLAMWWGLAVSARYSDRVLWLGCVMHSLWDAAHFGRVDFIPQWYEAACLAADVGLGAFVLLQLGQQQWRAEVVQHKDGG